MPSFRYPRLDSERSPDLIRLLKLYPSTHGGALEFDIGEYRLEGAPPYRAISYCWGGQTPTVLAYCNRLRLDITKNLDDALRTVCHLYIDSSHYLVPQYVWADAVCINQEDGAEKTRQVALMRAIFSRAFVTHIWLGHDTDSREVEKSFKMIRKHASTGRGSAEKQSDIDFFPRMLDFHIGRQSFFKPKDTHSLFFLLQRKWFSRIWIIQEATFSTNSEFLSITSGGKYLKCPWDDFHYAMLHFASHGLMKIFMALDDDLAFRLVQSRVLVKSIPGHGAGDLLHLLQEHRASQASEPKDKIFALLGMTGSVHCHQHEVDVNYNMTTVEVYTKVAKDILDTRRDLDLLSVYRTGQRNNSIADLPSWVPNWDQSVSRPLTSMRARYRGNYLWKDFNASGSDRPSFEISGSSLLLKGQAIDRITSIGKEFDPSPGYNPIGVINREYLLEAMAIQIRIMDNWKAIAGASAPIGRQYFPGESVYDAFLKCTIWNDFPKGTTIANLRATQEITDSLFREADEWSTSKWKLLKVWTRFAQGLEKHRGGILQNKRYLACVRRRMIRTCSGFIGLAPPLASRGDLIVIFQGSKVPHVIREKASAYELVGDCYVHGIMAGGVFARKECDTIRLV